MPRYYILFIALLQCRTNELDVQPSDSRQLFEIHLGIKSLFQKQRNLYVIAICNSISQDSAKPEHFNDATVVHLTVLF